MKVLPSLPLLPHKKILTWHVLKLNSIDNMRIDGKFYIGNDIPEGQGSVNSLLAECYELAYDLRAAVDEDKEDRGE
jgi:hypothetical protein